MSDWTLRLPELIQAAGAALGLALSCQSRGYRVGPIEWGQMAQVNHAGGNMGLQRYAVVVVVAAVAALGLAGCATSDSNDTSGQSPTASSAATASTNGGTCPISAKDTWAKAADSGDTAVFGGLTNTGTAEVTLTSATSQASERVEIHEVVDKDGSMVMQPKPGGLAIAAGSSVVLAPGQDHLMLMTLTGALKAGDSVTVTLVCADGSTSELSAIAKTYAGASEQYEPSPAHMESMGTAGHMGTQAANPEAS